ncbi:hypothetical protein, partial [Sphaerimonospora thailandensis]|uniref:hypothetical protein n=1 Tax=Sphaerimonospora thailandensis TaxID=795644 RepID=UPI0019505772
MLPSVSAAPGFPAARPTPGLLVTGAACLRMHRLHQTGLATIGLCTLGFYTLGLDILLTRRVTLIH